MKQIKHLSILAQTLLISVILSFSCSGGKNQEVDKLQQRIDSLQKVDALQKQEMNDLSGFISVLSDGLDSIAAKEDMLFSNKGREGNHIDYKQLKLNLEMFENMLVQQKERITHLSDSLKAKGAKIEILNSLVNNLNQQLDEKNRMIRNLRADLDKKNVSIAQLRSKVSSLTESNSQLAEIAERQTQALAAQDEIINEGYVKIGSKKELTSGGFISGGFLKKKKVNYDNLSKDKFTSVDIRTFRELTIKSSSPKILTQMPSSSYKIVKGDNGTSVLKILDPTSFWSITNFLIIQT